jgi:asparagine synthase (glutamine-hydrolysing)
MPPVAEMLERMVDVYDEPFRDPSHIPTYLISEYARRHVKVVLSGDGADELFGGYAWYPLLAASTELSASWLKWVILRSMSRLVGNRVRWLERHSQAVGLALRHPLSWARYVNYRATGRAVRRAAWARPRPTGDVPCYVPGPYYQPIAGTMGMNEVFYFDLVSYLPGDILVKVDRAAMAHGLETRAPFLDRDLVEFTLSLPSTLKVNEGETKILFKQAFGPYWPRELRVRGKQGFAGPYQAWFSFPDVKALTRRVFASGSALRELLPGLRADEQHNHNSWTWKLLTLGLWLERHPTLFESPKIELR